MKVTTVKRGGQINLSYLVLKRGFKNYRGFNFIPTMMSMADVEKIIGQSLKGRKSIRNPVNIESIANENNIPAIRK